MKQFIVSRSEKNPENPIIKMKSSIDLPFNVMRDLGRTAGLSYIKGQTLCFEFLIPERLEEGKKILFGAMFEEEVQSDAGDALGRNDYDNDLAADYK